MEFHLDEGIPILERTPRVLRDLLGDLSPGWIRSNEGGESWSPFDVVGHLIDGEETDWIPRARIILAQEASLTFTPFDRFRHLCANRGKPLGDLLDRFATLRAANVATLRGFHLTEEMLALRGVHPDFGPVTLRELLATWVAHDLGHIGQIVRVMAKQYALAVGPWRAYLPVLSR